MAATVEMRAEALIDGFPHAGQVDLNAEFAARLSVQTIASLLGLRHDDRSVRDWYRDLALALSDFSGEGGRSAGRATAAVVKETLVGACARPVASDLTDEEWAANLALVLFGGIETAESMLLNALWALLTHPDQLAAVRRTPALLPAAVEESLRWEPGVQSLTRFTTRAVTIGGIDLERGSAIQCMVGAANRDPLHFVAPDAFDASRPNASDHLTFGYGRHFCLGVHLARIEAAAALAVLLQSFPRLELVDADESRPRGHEFRKPRRLLVAFEP
jgi:cytochrome P450